MEEVISTKDPEAIKRKRSTIQGMMTTIRKNLERLLARTAGKFDHDRILRLRVQGEHASLKKHQKNFEIIHKAYLQYRERGKDDTEKKTLVEKQEEHYDEMVEKIYLITSVILGCIIPPFCAQIYSASILCDYLRTSEIKKSSL